MSPKIKALLVLVLIFAMGAGYIYYNDKQLAQSNISSAPIATSSDAVIFRVQSENFPKPSDSKIVDSRVFDLNGPWGVHKMYAVVYVTSSSSDELVGLYREGLPFRGYVISKENVTGNRTEILATNKEGTGVTIDIKPQENFETVTILLEVTQ